MWKKIKIPWQFLDKRLEFRTKQTCPICVPEARPSQGVPVPFFPWNKLLCSPVPQSQNLDFLCSLLPKISSPHFYTFVPWNKCPCSPKTLGGPHLYVCQIFGNTKLTEHTKIFYNLLILHHMSWKFMILFTCLNEFKQTFGKSTK